MGEASQVTRTVRTRRLSLAYFTNPNYDALIECLATGPGDGRQVLYVPVTAGEHRLRKILESTGGAPANATKPSPPTRQRAASQRQP